MDGLATKLFPASYSANGRRKNYHEREIWYPVWLHMLHVQKGTYSSWTIIGLKYFIAMIHAQNQDKTKDDFSRSQWRRHGKRRCRDCVLEVKRLSEQAKLSKIKKIQAQQSADLAKYMISQKEAVGGAPLETSCNKETTSDILASAEAISTCEKVLVALSQDIMVSGLQIVCG